MSLEKFVVFVLSISGCINAQETIDCAETIKGWRNQNEEVPLKFTASNDYSLVYLEGCPSTHDIWLEILDSNGNSIADADDRNEHGVEQSECGNKWAGDITIPNHVKRGEEYTFLVKGYENRHGDYTVTLICQNEDANTTTTTATPTSTPTPAPTTTTTTTTNDDDSHSAQCVERIRKPWHLISQQERDLFVNGWMELYRNGKLSIFTETHGDSSIDKHTNAAFLPWHRFFIWELETQFRSLGGEWECFALPYWLSLICYLV